VPPGSPCNAIDEVQAIRDRLGAHVTDQGMLDQLDQLITLLASAPSVLHFACHNQFDATGSAVNMADGPFRPGDLSIAVQRRGLASASPLVSFNACRTAGEIPGLVQMMGWAKQFMRAGAGAFLGSLWAVRSSSARTFAEAFYRAFVTNRMSLGAASLQARQEIADDSGDPTWLAYTVYGNPAATIGEGDGT
jgi:CHAT domain-containing protein